MNVLKGDWVDRSIELQQVLLGEEVERHGDEVSADLVEVLLWWQERRVSRRA